MEHISNKNNITLLDKKTILRNYKCQYNGNINLSRLMLSLESDRRNKPHITHIQYVLDRGGKIIIKMLSEDFKTTIKIFHSGKINIDGKHEKQHVIECQEWLYNLITKLNI